MAVGIGLANAAKESSEYLKDTSSMKIFIYSVNSHVFSHPERHVTHFTKERNCRLGGHYQTIKERDIFLYDFTQVRSHKVSSSTQL